MAYRPPQKRLQKDFKDTKKDKDKVVKPTIKDEFPELVPQSLKGVTSSFKAETSSLKAEPNAEAKPKMNFASLFKNVIKKQNKKKKLKWGTVLLTKKGMIDSLTQEEREEEEKVKQDVFQDNRLWKACDRLTKQQNLRREYDPHYESPDELVVSSSEEEEEEEEEIFTDDEYEEDEFEPEI
jgi:hypothetical protein